MIPVRIEGANVTLAKDQPEYKKLHIKWNPADSTMTSAWQPTPAEQRAIAAGANVRLHIVGQVHPPLWLDVGPRAEPVSSLDPADCPLCRQARSHEAPAARAPSLEAIVKAQVALETAMDALKRVADGKKAFLHDSVLGLLIRDMQTAWEGLE